MVSRIYASNLLAKKGKEPIVVATAYDATFAAIADEAGVDSILVGDSLGNVLLGYGTTLPVSLDDMVRHVESVARGASRALIIGDMPFGSYEASVEQAVNSAVALMKAGAQAVKLEGDYPEAVSAIVKAGIPVMAHLGFTPQSVNKFGGFKVQGKGENAERILAEGQRLSDAGAFAVVLELIPADLAKRFTQENAMATIGIGAGPHCDGQVQVLHDLLGLSPQGFKHAKAYACVREIALNAFRSYAEETRAGTFPTKDHSF